MSTKRLTLSIIAAAASALLGCAGSEGAAGSQTGRVEAPITAQVAPVATAAASPLATKAAASPLATKVTGAPAAVAVTKTPMPKAAPVALEAPTSVAVAPAAVETEPSVAAAPVLATMGQALVAKAKDSKYLSPAERLRVVGLAVDTACLGLEFDAEHVAGAQERLHAASGLTSEELGRHLPYFFGEPDASEAIGNARKLCEPDAKVPAAPELAKDDQALLDTLLAVTMGPDATQSNVVVDETTYTRTLDRLRTADDFRKAFVAKSLGRLASLEATTPGGPAAEQLPRAPQDDPPAEPPAGGCIKDTDCKGDRICVDGKCVPPPGEAPPPADPKPTDPTAPVDPIKPETVAAETLRFDGRLGSDGSFSFRLKGKAISGATANVKGRTFSLKTSGLSGGKFILAGKAGNNFVRVHGTYTAGKKWVKGTYDGTVDKQAVGGTFSASAR